MLLSCLVPPGDCRRDNGKNTVLDGKIMMKRIHLREGKYE